MTKFKVGDKVRVKSLDWYKTEYTNEGVRLSFVSDMSKFCGKIVTIEIVSNNLYYIKEDDDKFSWQDYMFEDEVIKEDNDIIKNHEVMEDNVKSFKTIYNELFRLYERKNEDYGNSFCDTYQKLGLISAVTRISDQCNRLCNLAINPNINNLGESVEDTLKDLSVYTIMTLMEIRKNNDTQTT